MATKKEIFNEAVNSIKSELKDKIQEVEWNKSIPSISRVTITLNESVSVDDMIAVAKIAYDKHDDMQVNEIKSRQKGDKSTPVNNVIEVALPL